VKSEGYCCSLRLESRAFAAESLAAYRISASLWPPIVMHWITVVVWTMFLGGKRLLTGS